jgi:hypothetical protein
MIPGQQFAVDDKGDSNAVGPSVIYKDIGHGFPFASLVGSGASPHFSPKRKRGVGDQRKMICSWCFEKNGENDVFSVSTEGVGRRYLVDSTINRLFRDGYAGFFFVLN